MQPGQVVQISPQIRRITAGNGSVFTGPGTNTYLVGTEEVTVIDPGPAMEEHIDVIISASKKNKADSSYSYSSRSFTWSEITKAKIGCTRFRYAYQYFKESRHII